MTINNVLNKNLIEINLIAKTKEEVLEKMADMLYKEGAINSKEDYLNDVFNREKLGTTGVGMSIAIPHGKSNSVKRTAVAIAKLHNPVEWNSLDDNPVRMVFLLAVPKEEDKNHLKLLSKLASMLMDDDFREKLLNAKAKDDILDAVNLRII
ncbi:PTS sugar transporter subunit IIA [Thermoanaerobacterium thermosaccharolyticum]|uniref:PTS sugar transporter subunit IIA n=1 Tax=Thermoanaerobacterium thermosaccharolyticum TaxID=1517 RepID=UPI003DA85645